MTTDDAMPYGYRIVGSCDRERRLVDYGKALAAYADCDDRAQIDSEGFLSPFQYDAQICQRVAGAGLDVRGYDGSCWSRYLWFDIDDEDVANAGERARRLCTSITARYQLDYSNLLVFYSGSKGFHIGLPTSLFAPKPSTVFNKVARKLAERLAGEAGVGIDTAIYSKVQPLRAPNSRHGKTGRHKRVVTVDELLLTSASSIVDRAAEPLPFELPDDPDVSDRAVEDWADACEAVRQQAEAVQRCGDSRAALNRQTLDFIRDGAELGDRHRLLYSAAANLAEFGCPAPLAHALLTDAALDTGLPPSDVRRAIDNALDREGGVQ